MSTEQSEGETLTAPAVTENSQADITQQATTLTPTTQKKENNLKRVAAGKKTAEKTRIARERQKALADAYIEMQNNKAKATAAAPEPAPTTEVESPKNSGLSINQWIAVGGLAVSLAGIYYKREELKPAPASVEPEPARAPQRKGLRKMD